MENPQLAYLTQCKKLIEEKLAWSMESTHWKQRDYLNLLSMLEEKTGISLSLSTVKRIWSDTYSGNPHPTTLDTLAKFLDYDNWLSFTQAQKSEASAAPSSPKPTPKSSYRIPPLLVLILGAVLTIFLLLTLGANNQQKGVSYDPQQVSFSSSNSQPNGVPNTVLFHYDLTSVEADSFFIQQSWNPANRVQINPKDSVLTCMYYYPGVHMAKLIANDSIIKETPLRINSNGWIATANYGMQDQNPSYINLKEANGQPHLHVNQVLLAEYQLDLNEHLHVSYFYVEELGDISGDDFELTLSLQADSILNLTCPSIQVMMLGSVEMHAFSLIDQGCVNQAYVKFGEVVEMGTHTDLTQLGIDVYTKQYLRIRVKDQEGQIYLNGQLISEVAYSERIGELAGFRIGFTGTGQIDSLRLNEDVQLLDAVAN